MVKTINNNKLLSIINPINSNLEYYYCFKILILIYLNTNKERITKILIHKNIKRVPSNLSSEAD